MTDPTTRSFVEEWARIWDEKAEFWDKHIGPEGNDFHRRLVAPAQRRLLDLQPGQRVLDVGCGNGQFAREMAGIVERVVACDVSPKFLERARLHTEAAGITNIDYRLVDATDKEALLALGEGAFDAGVATMMLMDIPVIEPLFAAVRRLLKTGGRFVFSVTHPCFNHPGVRMAEEQEERDGELVPVFTLRVAQYLDVGPAKGTGIRGEPAPHWYFNRPLSQLFGAAFDAGFVMDAIEEPAFDLEPDPQRAFNWRNYSQIPPLLVTRLRNPVPS